MDIKSVLAGEAGWALVQGDCLDVLRLMPDASVNAAVTDPPAGIAFMGKDWDHDKGGRDAWIAWLSEVMAECLRVLKPGGHALVWALPRTSHWTAMALEDAGFEIRDSLHHIQSQGFPKSLDVGKAIDKAQGAQRQVVGVRHGAGSHNKPNGHSFDDDNYVWSSDVQVTAPATDAAKQWDGWGTALKPSHEIWWLCRKPLDGTVAANVLAHGCGALNIDGCRVGDEVITTQGGGGVCGTSLEWSKTQRQVQNTQHTGRWPPNLLISHSPDCADECIEQCPVAELDRQSGTTVSRKGAGASYGASAGVHEGWRRPAHSAYGPTPDAGYEDAGGASRFFPVFKYQAKPSSRERAYGLPDGQRSTHPTVKSIELMRWLCRLVTPPNGAVLDPFAGSGSTGLACLAEGFRFIGIEREAEYVEIARCRLFAANTDAVGPLFAGATSFS